jgi:hypothetical protein
VALGFLKGRWGLPLPLPERWDTLFVICQVSCGLFHVSLLHMCGWGSKSLDPLARRHRVALGFLKGRWGLPLPLPER